MVGNKLEVSSLLVDAFSPGIKNFTKCVESAGGSISGLIFGPLAASRAVLSKNQRELGVVLIDIGFGKTGISVYEEGRLLHAAVFPVGAGNITNDLAIGLKTSTAAAENIKLSLGLALAKEAPSREQIDLNKFDPVAKGTAARRYIAEIIEARLAEILEFVNNDLKYIGKSARLPAGAVLVGGGAKLPAVVDLTRQELRLSAQIAVPNVSELGISNPELMILSEDPEFAVAFGLVLSGMDKLSEPSSKVGGGISSWFKRVFGIFTP
jgi:cell division protein FtsA